MKKFEFVFLLIPIFILAYFIYTNEMVNRIGEEYRFKIQQYDPLDIFRGKYLNLTIERDTIVIPELQRAYLSYQNHLESYINGTIMGFINGDGTLAEAERENRIKLVEEIIESALERMTTDERKDDDYIQKLGEYMPENAAETLFYEIIRSDLVVVYRNGYTLSELLKMRQENEAREEAIEKRIAYYNGEFYVYLDKDDEGYAKVEKVSKTKEAGSQNYIKANISTYGYSRNDVVLTTIHFPSSKLFVDERYAYQYETIVRDAVRGGLDVYILTKIRNGKMVIEDLYVDGLRLRDYFKTVNDNRTIVPEQ